MSDQSPRAVARPSTCRSNLRTFSPRNPLTAGKGHQPTAEVVASKSKLTNEVGYVGCAYKTKVKKEGWLLETTYIYHTYPYRSMP